MRNRGGRGGGGKGGINIKETAYRQTKSRASSREREIVERRLKGKRPISAIGSNRSITMTTTTTTMTTDTMIPETGNDEEGGGGVPD